jgi:hypothetical protein
LKLPETTLLAAEAATRAAVAIPLDVVPPPVVVVPAGVVTADTLGVETVPVDIEKLPNAPVVVEPEPPPIFGMYGTSLPH